MSEAHETVMRRFAEEVVSNGDFSVLDELVHPTYVFRSPGQEVHGLEGLRAVIGAYRTAFPDLKMTVEDLVAAGEKAVVSFTLTGTHEGDLMGIAATGRPARTSGMVLSRFEDGRIVEEWEVLDQLTMLQQLGVVSLPA
jgi:steroid delta-isomerase-like uncharacterized protein